ncbi:MAG: prepilin peptidase [Candidatus Omnitrophica bacterium]|nr:prepilin peptidase [Candidatus Omnitrophota bacterium]
MNISAVLGSAVFLLGLMVGSFLNVCIWRLPDGEQVVRGRSHCRACRQTIPWFDNVPLLSFLLLRGRCRFCRLRISWIYPAVELAAGLLFLAVLNRFGPTFTALAVGIFGAALIVISVVDAQTMMIPDEITKPGLGAALGVSFLVPSLHGTANRWESLGLSFLGALTGWGLIFGMAFAGRLLFRKKLKAMGEEEAVGGGDLKLMAMVGAGIGSAKGLLVVLFLAPLLGSLIGLTMKIRFHRDLIPYGPFLSLGTLIALFWGDSIIGWYRGLLIGY